MTKHLSLLAVAALSMALAASPQAADRPESAPKRVGGSNRTVTGHATVQAVDLATRHVTLTNDEGKTYTIVADRRIKRLDQLRVGDIIDVEYREAVVVDLLPAGTPASVAAEASASPAKTGVKPNAAASQRITIVATIEAIDEATQHVTLRGPEGRSFEVKARNPANLKKVKVGDVVRITYTEAVAISVRKPGSR